MSGSLPLSLWCIRIRSVINVLSSYLRIRRQAIGPEYFLKTIIWLSTQRNPLRRSMIVLQLPNFVLAENRTPFLSSLSRKPLFIESNYILTCSNVFFIRLINCSTEKPIIGFARCPRPIFVGISCTKLSCGFPFHLSTAVLRTYKHTYRYSTDVNLLRNCTYCIRAPVVFHLSPRRNENPILF